MEAMEMSTENLTDVGVVVINGDDHWLLSPLDECHALTLLALVSEDPECWEDMAMCWARYRTPSVAEWLDGLPRSRLDRGKLLEAISSMDAWLVIDLSQRRVLTSSEFSKLEENIFRISGSADEDSFPLGFCLPPWWEMDTSGRAETIHEMRHSSRQRPRIDRDFLYGEPLLDGLAKRILEVSCAELFASADEVMTSRRRYELTVEIHREWLMTPTRELDCSPRELLHGAHDWLAQLEEFQLMRMCQGLPMVALPITVSGFATAPFGRGEVIKYFEMCRELIVQGLEWCLGNFCSLDAKHPKRRYYAHEVRRREEQKLIAHLTRVQEEWMQGSQDGQASPELQLEYARRRVPQVLGNEIIGIRPIESSHQTLDCSCPICNLLAEGSLGPSVFYLDGHHLELDNDYAFSLCSTRSEWEKQQREYASWRDSDLAGETLGSSATPDYIENISSIDEPELELSGPEMPVDADLPCDAGDNLKLAFLTANILADLEYLDASPALIAELNERLTNFRRSKAVERELASKSLLNFLESLTSEFPSLMSKIIDLQSRIDRQLRRKNTTLARQ